MLEQIFQMRRQRDGFVLPATQTKKRADAKAAKSGCVTALYAVEAKIEIALRPGGMQFGIDATVISFLINDQPIRASVDNRNIILHFHRADVDCDRGKIQSESLHEYREIIAADDLSVLAGDE